MSAGTPATPIVGGDLTELSKKHFEDAAEDARILMKESPIIPRLVMVDIVARRLFLLVRAALTAEIENGWTVESPNLVLQTLGMSAQEKAVEEPGTALEIQRQLLDIVIPVIDIFVQMQMEKEQDNAESTTDKDTQVLPGSDAVPPSELGAILLGGSGDSEQQTGQRSEGDCEEDSGTTR